MPKSNEGLFTNSKKRLVAAISSGNGKGWATLDRYKQVHDNKKISIWLANNARGAGGGDLKLVFDGKQLLVRRFSGRKIAAIEVPRA